MTSLLRIQPQDRRKRCNLGSDIVTPSEEFFVHLQMVLAAHHRSQSHSNLEDRENLVEEVIDEEKFMMGDSFSSVHPWGGHGSESDDSYIG